MTENINCRNYISQHVIDVNTSLFSIKTRHEPIKRQRQDRKTADDSGKHS